MENKTIQLSAFCVAIIRFSYYTNIDKADLHKLYEKDCEAKVKQLVKIEETVILNMNYSRSATSLTALESKNLYDGMSNILQMEKETEVYNLFDY